MNTHKRLLSAAGAIAVVSFASDASGQDYQIDGDAFSAAQAEATLTVEGNVPQVCLADVTGSSLQSIDILDLIREDAAPTQPLPNFRFGCNVDAVETLNLEVVAGDLAGPSGELIPYSLIIADQTVTSGSSEIFQSNELGDPDNTNHRGVFRTAEMQLDLSGQQGVPLEGDYAAAITFTVSVD